MFQNRITQLLGIDFPIIQAGMIWASGWRLCSAVSNAGGFGMLGAGSMYPDVLEYHIKKCKENTNRSFGVNIPLLYPNLEEHIEIILKNKIHTVFTSAGNPATYTSIFKKEGIRVVHVVSSSKFARKAEAAGCDAVVAEGFEAGGHNGREETTTLVLIPLVVESVSIPVIAAGGIATGRQMLANMILGAEGVQIGSRFVATPEASSHPHFKQKIVDSIEGDTVLTLKELTPVRLLKNDFYNQILQAKERGATKEELNLLLGRGRAKKGMFEGDMDEGELEIGQVSALIKSINPAAEVLQQIWSEFIEAQQNPIIPRG